MEAVEGSDRFTIEVRDKIGPSGTATYQGGSQENLRLLVAGSVELAIVQADVLAAVASGQLQLSTDPEPDQDLAHAREPMVVAPLFTEVLHLLVRNPLALGSVEGLSGFKIIAGKSAESGSFHTVSAVMDTLGIPSGQRFFIDRELDCARAVVPGLLQTHAQE